MWKNNKSRAEQHFSSGQKKSDAVIKQKERTQRERDDRMARLRDLRLAKEAAELKAAGQPVEAQDKTGSERAEAFTARLPKVHPHRS